MNENSAILALGGLLLVFARCTFSANASGDVKDLLA